MAAAPDDLYAKAQSGKGSELSATERRLVIAHMDEIGELSSNLELAQMFGVDERQIRKDKARLVRAYAKRIAPDQAMNFIAAYTRNHDILIAQARKGLKAANPGTPAHQYYVKLISDLEERKVTKLQSIGVIPKELGRLAITEEKWIAVFSDEGTASVHPDDDSVEVKELEAGTDPTIEAEVLDAA